MTNTIKFTAPATVAVKAQSVARDVDPSTLHEDTLTAVFTYGLRRWFQDSINSQAHAAKQADVEFDAEAAFDARLAMAETGDIHVRGGSAVDPMQSWRRKAVRQLARDNDKLAALIADAEPGKARNEVIDTVAANNEAVVNPIAERLRENAAKTAKTAADAAESITI